mgnify:CR=1 FL=1
MYLNHFKLLHKPFSLTPDPAFLYLSQTHREALGHLLYGLNNRTGFIAIIGEVGTGKTTLLRTLLAQLPDQEFRTAFIFNPRVSSLELLRAVMREFDLSVGRGGRDEMLDALNQYLLEQNALGHTVVLVIDEAQNLGAAALEEVRLLSNLETETDKLLQIVLVGQPELAKTLEDRKLRQLRQRITVFYRLLPLTARECMAYARHRIEVAGGDPDRLFRRATLLKACRACKGIPRKLNVMLDRALLTAFTHEASQVTKAHLQSSLRDLQTPMRDRSWRYLALGAVFLLLVTTIPLLRAFRGEPVPSEGPIESIALQQGASAIHPLAFQLSTLSSLNSRNLALGSLLELWGKQSLPIDTAAPLVQIVRSRQLQLHHFNGSFEEFMALNTPALIPIRLPGVEGLRFVALLQSSNDSFTLAPLGSPSQQISHDALRSFWNDEALIPWNDSAAVSGVLQLGDAGQRVAEIQKRLLGAGFFAGVFDGNFDRETLSAVRAFQHFAKLPIDGKVGPQTLIRLYQAGGMDDPVTLNAGQG